MNLPVSAKRTLYAELGKLLSAGFPVTQAVETLLDQGRPGAESAFLTSLAANLETGQTIGQAVGAAVPSPGGLDTAVISASERAGKLDEGFTELAEYHDVLSRAWSQVRAGLIYPLILVHLGALLPLIFKGFVGNDWPGAIATTLFTLLVVYLLLAACVLGGSALAHASSNSPGIDRALRRVPLAGGLKEALSLWRFCFVLRSHVLAAFRATEALAAAAEAGGSAILKDTIHTALPGVHSGMPFTPLLRGKPGVPRPLQRSLETAEKSGTLDHDLAKWTRFYRERAATIAERIASWLPRFAFLLVALYLAVQIVSTYSRILGGYRSFLE